MLWNIKFLFSQNLRFFILGESTSQRCVCCILLWEQMINACCYLYFYYGKLLIDVNSSSVRHKKKSFSIKFLVFRVKKQSVILFTMIYVSSHAMHKRMCFVSVDDERQMFFHCECLCEHSQYKFFFVPSYTFIWKEVAFCYIRPNV